MSPGQGPGGDGSGSYLIIAEANRNKRTSICWFDFISVGSNLGILIQEIRSGSMVGRAWSLLHSCGSPHRALVALHNSSLTQIALLLSWLRVLRKPVVVLELNLKTQPEKVLRRWFIRQLYSRAAMITALAPSDARLLREHFGISGPRISVLKQWAQPDIFEERAPAGASEIVAWCGGRFLISAGRSSRNLPELFEALGHAPGVKLVLVGGSGVPENLRDRVRGVPALPFEELVYLMRRASGCVIPLAPVQHTCGVRVWFQAAAMGLPVVITRTEATGFYETFGRSAEFYSPGDISRLAELMERLCSDPEFGRVLAEDARRTLESQFSPELYNREVLSLLAEQGQHG